MPEVIHYEDYEIALATPWKPPDKHFAGRVMELKKCQAAWKITHDGKSFQPGGALPLNFRLEGPPGVGKNEIVYQIARLLAKPLYIIQGHEELTPEDLALLLVPYSSRKSSKEQGSTNERFPLRYQASPLATAILVGGLFFFDEINRVPERALSPLASVLDERRSVYSSITGLTIKELHGQEGRFRFCCALNPVLSDAGRGVLPDYIEERTLPALHVDYLKFDDLFDAIKKNLNPDESFLSAFQDWHVRQGPKNFSVRQAMTMMNYAMSLAAHGKTTPAQALKDAESDVRMTPGPSPADDFVDTYKPPPPPPPLHLPPSVNPEPFFGLHDAKTEQPLLFEVTGNNLGPLWGGGVDLYTDDSNVGMAAVHAGVLKMGEKGVVQITLYKTDDGRKFHGSQSNGVKSNDWSTGWRRGYRIERSPYATTPATEAAADPKA